MKTTKCAKMVLTDKLKAIAFCRYYTDSLLVKETNSERLD